MRRRSIVLLAGGLLLAVSPPVFGIGDQPAPDPDQSATTSTTMGTDPEPTSTTTTVPDGPGMTPGPGDGTSPDPGDDTTDPGDDTTDPGDDTTDPGDDTTDPGDDTTDPGDDTTDPGDDTTDPGDSPSPDPDDDATDPGGSSKACDTPDRIHEPAPAEGESVMYDAGEAGQVEVRRASATELEIVQVVPNDGWEAEVREEIGPRVKARFTDQAGTKVRFAASMDDAGEEIHIRVSTCG